MKKFKVSVPLEYIAGHLRYGHLEIEVEADNKEDAIKKAKDMEYDMEVVVDDYEVNEYGDVMWKEVKADEQNN